MRDLMLDLETWGKRPGCAIRSIGAVLFDPTSSQIGEEFYVNVTRESCEAAGLHVDPDTEAWWSKQTRDAQDALLVDQMPIGMAIDAFFSFFRRKNAARIWSQGANFDQPIIEAAAHAVQTRGVPWKFWDSRCTRTAYGLAGLGNWDMPKRGGTHHNALDDAKYQSACVQLAYRKLKLNYG